MSDPLHFDRGAMILANLAAINLIDEWETPAKRNEQIVRAYLWAKDNASYDAEANTTTYPSWAGLQEWWPEIAS